MIEPDRALIARYNIRIEDVKRLINTALGGEPVGALYEGDRRFDIVAKLDRSVVTSPQAIGRLPVYTPDGVPVPLAQVAKIKIIDGQTIIARENGVRRMTVRCDIRGRDQGGFVADAQRRFADIVGETDSAGYLVEKPGYRVEWLGMFENLERARTHFTILIPLTIGLIFVMLWVTFGSQRAAIVVLLAVPFACIGGVLACMSAACTSTCRAWWASPPCSAWRSWTACSWSAGSRRSAGRAWAWRTPSWRGPKSACGRSS